MRFSPTFRIMIVLWCSEGSALSHNRASFSSECSVSVPPIPLGGRCVLVVRPRIFYAPTTTNHNQRQRQDRSGEGAECTKFTAAGVCPRGAGAPPGCGNPGGSAWTPNWLKFDNRCGLRVRASVRVCACVFLIFAHPPLTRRQRFPSVDCVYRCVFACVLLVCIDQ